MKKTLFTAIYFSILSMLQAQQQTDTLNIFFDINKSDINNRHAKLLDSLIADPNVSSISIYGYADFLGNAACNQELSEKRCISVRNYLIQKGINKENIVLSKGEGVHPNSDEKNRRDLSDKGIQAHRMVRVVYSAKSQAAAVKEKLSEKNLVVGNSIVLEEILFHPDSDEFLAEAYIALEEFLKTMRKYSTLKVEIQGHICCQRNDLEEFYVYEDDKPSGLFGPGRPKMGSGGKPLSLNRAQAVRNYLIENGIDSTRMTYKGYGATRKRFPHERNQYEAKMNRRVEILILGK